MVYSRCVPLCRNFVKFFPAFLIAAFVAVVHPAYGDVIFEHDFEGIIGDGQFATTWGPEFSLPPNASGQPVGNTLNPATSGSSAGWLSPVPAELGTSFGTLFRGGTATASGLAVLAPETTYTLSFTQFRRDDNPGSSVRARIFSDSLGSSFVFSEGSFDAVTTRDTFVERSLSFTTPDSNAFIFTDLFAVNDTIGINFTDLTDNGAINQVAIDNIRLTAVAVPEPSSLAVLLGLGGFVGWRRRRIKTRSACPSVA